MERIVEVWEKISPHCYKLAHSNIVAAQGAISYSTNGKEIFLLAYATFQSPIHNLTASPAERLVEPMDHWNMSGFSNGKKLIAKSKKHKAEQGFVVETSFSLAADYDGPPYKKRTLHFDQKLWLTKIEMEYADGRHDRGEIRYDEKQTITICWECEHGPNHCNVSFA